METAGEFLNATDPVVYGIKIRDRFDVDRVVRRLESADYDGAGDNELGDRRDDTVAGDNEIGQRRDDTGAASTPTITTWREFNRGIFGALRMEKSMMVFLVGLIFLVVAGNIYQLLKRSILERSEEIAILRAIGAGAGELRLVFVLEGWLIGVIGTVVGISLGLFISGTVNELFAILEWVTRTLGDRGIRVFSPAYFYIEEIPREIAPGELLAIAVGAIGVSVAAARWAAAAVVRVHPMELLRNE
jgi:lipoprotein-releasing system permease protein